MGLNGWRRCVFLKDLMAKVVYENRYPDLETDGEQMVQGMKDDRVVDDNVHEQTSKRHVSLGKRCEKHIDMLMRWEVFHMRDSLIDNSRIVRHIARCLIARRTSPLCCSRSSWSSALVSIRRW